MTTGITPRRRLGPQPESHRADAGIDRLAHLAPIKPHREGLRGHLIVRIDDNHGRIRRKISSAASHATNRTGTAVGGRRHLAVVSDSHHAVVPFGRILSRAEP
jgi:hypothetical protein